MHEPAQVLDALGSPTRRSIVQFLAAGPAPVGRIADAMPISRPGVSQQVRILESAGLVTLVRRGRLRVVALNPQGFAAARDWLDGFWTEGLARFAALAEATWTPNGDVAHAGGPDD